MSDKKTKEELEEARLRDYFIPKARKDPKFPDGYNWVLLDTLEKVEEITSKTYDFMSFDTETTGLNPETSDIVGYSISVDPMTGYYIPVNHSMFGLGKPALDLVYDCMCRAKLVAMANSRFDIRQMEYYGDNDYSKREYLDDMQHTYCYDMSKVKIYDIFIGVFLADTNRSYPGLKWAEAHFLGWEGIESFEQALGGQTNFYYVTPKDATFYAATDALGTYRVAMKTIKYAKEAKFAGKLDAKVLYPLTKYENQSTLIDPEWLEQLTKINYKRIVEVEREMFKIVGRVFKPGSPKDCSIAFSAIGVDTGVYSKKTGFMSSGKEIIKKALGRYPEGSQQYRLLELLLEWRPLQKSDSSYIKPLTKYSNEGGGRLRFAYKVFAAPTARLAAGADGKNSFFAKMNIQAITKPGEVLMYAEKSDDVDSIRGWSFKEEPTDKTEKVVEAFAPYGNIRRAFKADPGFTWVSIDYSTQELRAAANISREKLWINTFNSGGDLHKTTAMKIWGEDKYSGKKRTLAKVANFGIIYGMSAYSFQDKFGMERNEAEKFVNDYKKALPALFQWIGQQEKRAAKLGTTYTYFGRPRRVRHMFASNNYRQIAFGKRTAVNTVIQGFGADLLKLTLCKLWQSIFTNPKYEGDVFFRSTIHDEVNFVVRTSRLEEICIALLKVMTTSVPGWETPFTCGLELGPSWGVQYAYNFDLEKGVILDPSGDKYNPETKEIVEEEIEEPVSIQDELGEISF